jgi:hypothetical protein
MLARPAGTSFFCPQRSDVNVLLTLVEEAGYDDIEVKSGDVTVKYYNYSVIYESIK